MIRYRLPNTIFIFGLFLLSNSLFSADRYWVGGAGTWDASNIANWAASSAGTPGETVPTSSDNVFINGSSGGGTITISATANCANLTWSATSGTLAVSSALNVYGDFSWSGAGGTLSGSSALKVYGSFLLNSSMTRTYSGTLTFASTAAGKTITTGTITMPKTIFNGVGGGWTFQDAYNTSTRDITITNGTIATGNNTLTCGTLTYSAGTFTIGTSTLAVTSLVISGGTLTLAANQLVSSSCTVSSGSLTLNSSQTMSNSATVSGGTLTFGATQTILGGVILSSGTLNTAGYTLNTKNINATGGTLTLGASTVNIQNSLSTTDLTVASAVTLTANTSTINFTETSTNYGSSTIVVYLGTKTSFNNLVFPAGPYIINIFDGGTVNNLTLGANNVVILEGAKTYTVAGTITATGTCTGYISFVSSSNSAATLALTGTQAISYTQFKKITQTGASCTIDNYVDAGGNTFAASLSNSYAARTLYWRAAGTGNWSTADNWTTTNDGISSSNTCLPTMIDNINFNNNSGSGVRTITVDKPVYCNDLICGSIAGTPTFTNSASSNYPIFIGRDLNLTGMSVSNAGTVYFIGSGNQKITSAGKAISSGISYFQGSGTYYLEDDGYIGTFYLKSGIFDVQNSGATTVYNLYVSGDWWHTGGTFTPRANAANYVIFNHPTDDQYLQSAETFYNLQVNKSTSTAKLFTYADETITNELKVTSGWYRVYVYTSTVNGSVTMANAGTIYGYTGTLTYNNNSATNFSFPEGAIWLDGMTLNVGVSGSHTLTSLIVGNAASNSATLTVSGSGILNIVDQLLVKSDGIMDVQSGTVNIKTNTTNGGTAGISKWQIDASGQFKQSGGTINLLGAADNNTTNALSFSTSSTFTAGDITGGTVVLQSTTSTYDYPVDFGGKTLYNLTVNQASRTFKQISNPVILKGNFTISAGTYDANGQSMSIAKNWVNTNGTFIHNNNTVTFNGTSILTTGGNASTKKFYNVTLNGTSATLAGNIDVDNNFTITAGTWDVSATPYSMIVGANWSNGGTFTPQTGTVTFDGAVAQAITTGGVAAGKQFYNVTVNNSAGTPDDVTDVDADAIFVSNNLVVTDGQFQPATTSDFKNVEIQTNGILKPDASASVTVSGAWLNTNGTFTHNSGTVTFDGTAAQTVTTGGIAEAKKFCNVIINNTVAPGATDGIVLAGAMDLINTGVLTLTDGIIIPNGNLLIVENPAATAIVAGGANAAFDASWVYGTSTTSCLRKYIADNTDTYTFPVGIATRANKAVFINNSLTDGGTFYIDAWFNPSPTNPNTSFASLSEGLTHYTGVHTDGVWVLDHSGTINGTYDLKLYFNGAFASLADNKFSILSRPTGSVTGADWTMVGTHSNTTTASGYVYRTGLNSFSEKGLGISDVALPVELLNFAALCTSDNVEVVWSTASEQNSDYFILERSTDLNEWSAIGTKAAAGNSNSIERYQFIDNSVELGFTYYYRLRQVDLNGDFEYFGPVNTQCNENVISEIIAVNSINENMEVLFSSPVSGKEITFQLINMTGQKLTELHILSSEGINKIRFENLYLSAGVYMLNMDNGIKLVSKKFMMK